MKGDDFLKLIEDVVFEDSDIKVGIEKEKIVFVPNRITPGEDV